MVIGLQALEFTDCLLDSPEFRENLNRHEKELDKTSQQIKRIVKEVKDLLAAAKNLSRAQRTLSKSLCEFNFECIGSTQTDDEQVIVDSLKQFGKLIAGIEDERDNMLARAHDQIVVPLESFRKDHIGGVKDNKKKFDKKTAKFCQAQERFLNMSSKKPDNTIQEADAHLGMLEREYLRESLSYVLRIQDVQERIKFEFVETLLSFMSGWLVFYHLGHEVAEDAKEYMTDLQHKVQKTRENFDETRLKAEELKCKYMDSKMNPETEFTKQGYLFLMEKKAFTATWCKYYCTYKKQQKQFAMLQYNQMSGRSEAPPDTLTLASCTRRASEFEKRFCFDLSFDQKPGIVYTFQALSEEDRKAWLNAMDGKEPTYLAPGKSQRIDDYQLDDVGFAFVRKCIEALEQRGLEEEGLYRIGGVGTKITKLISLGTDRKKTEKERASVFYDDQYSDLLESKTISSALKHFLRNLGEPLMTYRYHNGFIAAAKQETRLQRISDVHTLMYRLPKPNFDMLDIVIRHLKAVSMKCNKNKMSVFNLGVVFGPTLLRALEETVASILDIKFNNVVIEILIENYDLIFKTPPGKNSEYLNHPNAPEPIPRTHGAFRGSRVLYAQQPVVRVVAKSNYTDPVMSSSLQNIPNGIGGGGGGGSVGGTNVYGMTTSAGGVTGGGSSIGHTNKNNHHVSAYEASKHTTMNQSTPSLVRDVTLSPRDRCPLSSRIGGGGGEPTYITESSGANNHHGGGHTMGVSMHNNHYTTGRRESSAAVPMNRSVGGGGGGGGGSIVGDGIYGQRMNPITFSDTNLVQPRDFSSIIDRINSTSSSNESVCSSSSRDLNHHSPYSAATTTTTTLSIKGNGSVVGGGGGGSNGGHVGSNGGGQRVHSSWTSTDQYANSGTQQGYGHIRDEPSQVFLPKKTQRTSKEIARHKYSSSKDNVRVRTLYACLAENDGELSFEPNQIITNVRPSNEPGWLEGSLNGKSGLIPENYVEVIP